MRHQPHRKAYLCRWCPYADLVTDRFQFHLSSVHGRTIDPESCFSGCNVFFTLKSCDVRGCNFITNTKEKLERHVPDHDELEDDPPLVRSVMLGELSHDLQVKVVEEHRRNMGKQSAMNKTVEREEGLISPPLELMIRPNPRTEPRADPTSEPSSPPRIAGFGRGKIRLVDEEEEGGQQPETRRRRGAMMTKFPYEEGEQPVASRTRQRARGRAVSHGNDNSPMRRERARVIQEELTKAMNELPFPQRVRRPTLLPMEKAARARSQARYIAELTGGRRIFYMCFYELITPCDGTLIQRVPKNNIVVTGCVINYHAGSPGMFRGVQSVPCRWDIKGPMYDTYTRPWTVVRKVQLESTPSDGMYYVFDPRLRERHPAEVFAV